MNPCLSSHTLRSPQPTLNFRSKTAFVRCSQNFDARNKRKMHTACNTDSAAHTTHHTTPAPDPHQPTLRRMCFFYSAGFPPQCLVELLRRDRRSAAPSRYVANKPKCPDPAPCRLLSWSTPHLAVYFCRRRGQCPSRGASHDHNRIFHATGLRHGPQHDAALGALARAPKSAADWRRLLRCVQQCCAGAAA